jgi:hypothetical protein
LEEVAVRAQTNAARGRQGRWVLVRAHIAVAAGGLAVVLTALLHALRPDVHRRSSFLSEFGIGPYRTLMTTVFLLVAIAVVSLAVALRHSVQFEGLTALTPALLSLSGASLVVAGLFPAANGVTDGPAYWIAVHARATQLSFTVLTAAMLLFAAACRTDPRWRGFFRSAVGLAGVWIGAQAVMLAVFSTSWVGMAQRATAVVLMLWLGLTAAAVRNQQWSPAPAGDLGDRDGGQVAH